MDIWEAPQNNLPRLREWAHMDISPSSDDFIAIIWVTEAYPCSQ